MRSWWRKACGGKRSWGEEGLPDTTEDDGSGGFQRLYGAYCSATDVGFGTEKGIVCSIIRRSTLTDDCFATVQHLYWLQ